MSPRGSSEPASRKRFLKEDRLLLRPEFRRAVAMGTRRVSAHFIVYLSRNQAGRSRLGITASRKVGNAVVRNRIKRLVREYFRACREHLSASRDYLVIARRAEPGLRLADVARELDRAIGVER